jgi:branched-chain amino acid aminotransferase
VITIAGGEVGPVAQKYYDAITGIQYGKAKDPLGWVAAVA